MENAHVGTPLALESVIASMLNGQTRRVKSRRDHPKERLRIVKKSPPDTVTMAGRTAILIVNGFHPRSSSAAEAVQYPWIALCLRELTRRSADADYQVLVWDNAGLEEHRRVLDDAPRVRVWPRRRPGRKLSHARALDELVRRTDDDTEFLITLDTDALPIRDGWIGSLVGHLEAGAGIAGVWRDEMTARLRPFVHVSCLCIRRAELLGLDVSFARRMGQDVGQNLTDELRRLGRPIVGLRRSNQRNAHFLIGGIYGDLIYHHAAGSRRATFRTSTDPLEDERIRVLLREAAFCDLDHLVAVLRGQTPNNIW